MQDILNHRYEGLFPAMRELGKRADALSQRATQDFSTVGSSHVDPLAQSEAMYAILRALRNSASPDQVKQAGIDAYRLVIAKHNAKADWQTQRSDCGAEMHAIRTCQRLGLING